MINDKRLVLADALDCITSSGAKGDVIDLGIANPNIGAGTKLVCRVTINTDLSGNSANETVVISLQDSADNSTFADLLASEAYNIDGTVVGQTLLEASLPKEHMRYLRIYALFAGTTPPTAGKIDAYINVTP